MTIKSQRILFASLKKSRGVCRFAALTEEEQKEVVEKVKAKLKEKFPDAVGEDGSVQLSDEEDVTGEAPVDTTEQGNTEEVPADTQEDVTEEGNSEPSEEQSKGGIDGVLSPDDLDWGDGDSKEEPATEESSEVEDSEDEDDSADGDESADSEVEDSEEEPKDESKEAGGEITAEEDNEEEEGDSEVEEIADDIEEDVENIKGKDGIDSSNMLKLFSDMMAMVNLLVKVRVPRSRSSKPKIAAERIASSLVQGSIAESVARFMVAKRGLQMNRKDSDLIHDTGGTSKGADKDTDQRPPRDDVRKRFRTKDKPADQRDPDTDNDKDKRSD